MYLDYTYAIFVLPALIFGLVAQAMVKTRFGLYDKVKSRKGITGAEAALLLLRANGITDVKVQHIGGNLSDNYNPGTKILSLSDSTYSSTSIAAIGVAAHETGHAIQHATKYAPLNLRRTLVPAANLGSQLGPLLAIAGILFGSSANSASVNQIAWYVAMAGIVLYALAVIFTLVTLPVEFNASHRAMRILKETNTLEKDELKGVRKVLWAAAMTYVASAMSAIGNLLRLFVLTQGNKKR